MDRVADQADADVVRAIALVLGIGDKRRGRYIVRVDTREACNLVACASTSPSEAVWQVAAAMAKAGIQAHVWTDPITVEPPAGQLALAL